MYSIKTSIDLKHNIAVNVLDNPLSTIDRTALLLGIADAGYSCFDTTLNKPYYWTGTIWITYTDVFTASETIEGTVEYATQSETNAGTMTNRVITPATLAAYINFIGFTKSFLLLNANIAGGVPYLVTFPTVAAHKDAFMCNVKDSMGNQVFADVDSINTTGFTITSNSTLLNLTVFTTYL